MRRKPSSLLFYLFIATMLLLSPGCQTTANDDDTAPDDDDDTGDDDDATGAPYVYEGQEGGPTGIICGEPDPLPADDALCAVTAGQGSTLLRGIVLASDSVLMGGEVLVDSTGEIACVGCDCSAEMADGQGSVVSCPYGVISPGLINAHDHISFIQNHPVGHGDERYEHRHDWRKGNNGHTRLTVSGSATWEQKAWGELRFVVGGATSILGSGSSDGLLRNLDRDQEGLGEGQVHYETFPLGDSSGSTRQSGCDYPNIDGPSVLDADAYAPHIAEGIDLSARNELICLSSEDNGGTDLVESNTAIIHAVAITAPDAAMLSHDGASVIWSPRSNVDLYGNTAQATLLNTAGVNIALGTDWTPSGSMNVLRELACADYLNNNHFGGWFGDWQLWQMATSGAARAAGVDDATGSLAVGLAGDIAIFDGRDQASRPFRALLDSGPGEVHLVLRGGDVLYGDSPLVEALADDDDCEELTGGVCGSERMACLQSEVGISFADLEQANSDAYDLFFCEEPESEPSCVPYRAGEYESADVDDVDGDGITGSEDNCPTVFNPIRPMDLGFQRDHDDDGQGDVCDLCPLGEDGNGDCIEFDPEDRDSDGSIDSIDNCPTEPNFLQEDQDGDGTGDACDPCPTRPNAPGEGCPATVYEIKQGLLDSGLDVALTGLQVTAVNEHGFFSQVPTADRDATLGASYSGLWAYSPTSEDFTPPSVGSKISFQATVNQWFGQWQVTDARSVTTEETGLSDPSPEAGTIAQLATGGALAEALEGLLVTAADAEVTAHNPIAGPGDLDPTGAFVLDDSLRVNDFLYSGASLPLIGDTYSVTGILRFANDDSKIEPRSAADIQLVQSGPPQLISMEPAQTFLYLGMLATTLPPLIVTIDRPAPTGGTAIALTSADTNLLDAPSTVVIPQGQTSQQLSLSGIAVSSGPVTLEASWEGTTLSAGVEVIDPSRVPVLAGIEPATSSVAVGSSLTYTVSFDIPATPGNQEISLTVAPGTFATGPSQLTIPIGELSADFVVDGIDAGSEVITATFGGASVNADLTVTAQPDIGLVLSEVFYDAPGSDTDLEWVEIYNGGGSTIDLSTWSLGAGGGDYLNTTHQLVGSLAPGDCFVVGGPDSTADNASPGIDQVGAFSPPIQNSGSNADGLGLFNLPAVALDSSSVPVDSVVYGSNNDDEFVDSEGNISAVDVGDAPSGSSLEQSTSGWSIQSSPSPGDCTALLN